MIKGGKNGWRWGVLGLCLLPWTQALATSKPTVFMLDTKVTEPPNNAPVDGGHVANSLAEAFERRFKPCATTLTSEDTRALIGLEKQRQLFGGDDSSTLAEIGSALGRKGVVATSSLVMGPNGSNMEMVLISRNGKRLGRGTASCAGNCGWHALLDKVIDDLPDLCMPQWEGEITYQYKEYFDSSHRAEVDGGSEQGLTDHFLQLDANITLRPEGLGHELATRVTPQVSGKDKIKTLRKNEALCGGEQGPEKVVTDGYREEFEMTNTFAQVLCENDSCTASVDVATDPAAGRFSINPRVASMRYSILSNFKKTTEDCGRSETESNNSDSEQQWPGSSPIHLEGAFAPGQTQITGQHSVKQKTGEDEKTTVQEIWKVNLNSRPMLDFLAR
ncbi:MAG: hypothetical protein G8345_02910 [Magnetococcales bacterium]|nr:hypothetical protein [Magnetococcales bacterium]